MLPASPNAKRVSLRTALPHSSLVSASAKSLSLWKSASIFPRSSPDQNLACLRHLFQIRRVQVLEAENARLANLAGSSAESPPKRASSPADEDDEDDEAALEELRSQLAAADERELSLQAELAEMRAAFSRLQTERVSAPPPPTIKAEEHDDQFDPRRASPPSSPKRSSKKLDGGKEKDKSTGSVAFMVLLLSLSLLSTHNAPTPAPVAQSLPTPFSYAHQNQNSFEGMDFDFESILGGSNSMSGANWMGAPNGGLKWDDDDLDFGGIGLGSSLTNPTLSLLPPSRASPASSSSSALTTTAATQKTVELVLRHPDSENTLSSSQPIPDNFDFTFQLPSSSSAPTSFASEENKTVKVSVRRPTATVTAAPSPSAWCQDWSADMDLDKLTTISTTPGENSAKRVTVEVKAHGRGTSSPSASGEDLQLDDIERWEVVVRD